jgi:S-layer family protein
MAWCWVRMRPPPPLPLSAAAVSELPGPSVWGTGWNDFKIGPGDFIRRSGCTFDGTPDVANLNGILPAAGQSSICIGVPVHLPTGARLSIVELDYADTNPVSEPSMGLWKHDASGVSSVVAPLTPSAFSGGNRIVVFTLNETINNFNSSYYLLVILERSTITPSQFEEIYALHLGYTLQVSPAPGVASFGDVPTTHPWFQWIEALKASGITAGCSATPPLFCPDAPVTRGQMAIFLSRGLGLYWPY